MGPTREDMKNSKDHAVCKPLFVNRQQPCVTATNQALSWSVYRRLLFSLSSKKSKPGEHWVR